MKKIALIAAMSLAALVSCTKNEPAPSVTDQQEITFASPIMSPATKAATEIADNFPTENDFAVFAHYYESGYTTLAEGIQYMNNVKVTYGATPLGTNGSWGSNPAYYWPKGGSLTFAAYAPHMAAGATYDATGIHFSDYKIADSAENQVDLLFSERAYDQTSADQTDPNPYYYGVQINFLHALSSIKFKVAMESTLAASALDYEFVVTKIDVLKVYSQGDFNQKLTDVKDNKTPVAASGDWTDYQTETNYVAYNDATGISLTDATVKETVTGSNATNLILLPQKMKHGSAADASDEVKVQVTYKMRHKEMNAGEYINTVSEVSLNSSALVKEWLRGKRYVYTLTLGLEEIRFAPKVESWDEQTVTDLPTIK